MIELTNPNGEPVFIFKAWIQLFRQPLPGEYKGLKVGAVIVLSGAQQAVQETIDQVMKEMIK